MVPQPHPRQVPSHVVASVARGGTLVYVKDVKGRALEWHHTRRRGASVKTWAVAEHCLEAAGAVTLE